MPTAPLRLVRDIDQAAAVIGQVLVACQDADLLTFLSAYRALIAFFGRPMSGAESIQTMPAWAPSPLQFRLACGVLCIESGLRHAASAEAEKHWRKSDSHVRALARAEAMYFRQRMTSDPRAGAVAAEFKRLSQPEGWSKPS